MARLETPYEALDEVSQRLKAAENAAYLTTPEALANLHFAQAESVHSNARRLVGNINSLIKTLERERDQIMRDPLRANPNVLGIMQSQSSSVEAGVGEFMASKEALKRVEVALGLADPSVF